MPSNSTHAVTNGRIPTFSWSNNIPVNVHTMTSLSIHLRTDTGCFHVLAVENTAAMNMGVQITFWNSVFLYFGYSEAVKLDYVIVLFLIFWGLSILFSIIATPIYIPINSAWGFPSFTSSPMLVILSFDERHSNQCEVIAHCGFDLHFPDDLWCWPSFHVPVGHLYVFFGKMSIQVLCPF